MDPDAQRILLSALGTRRNGENCAIELRGADLAGVHALSGDLVGAELSEAYLEAACLAGARLSRAKLQHADLAGADLDGADLTEADLRGADLTAASLDDAVLTNADLRGACLAGVLGDPLSMTGALIDAQTIERSGFRMRDIAQLVVRGAQVDERTTATLPPKMGEEAAPAPSPVSERIPSLPPSLREVYRNARPSIIESLRQQEAATRHERVDQDEEVPASLRSFKELNALIREARGSDSKPPSMRPPSMRPPSPSRVEIEAFELPTLGDELLGLRLDEELPGGTIARTYRASSRDGESFVVKVFDPKRSAADIQLAAFQRGVRAMNRVQALDNPNVRVAELVAVSTDQTAYAMRNYDNGSVENLVEVAFTMQGGLEIFRSVCESVAALNRHGVLVRSIKPSNLLIDGLTPLISEIDMLDLPTLAQTRGDLAGYGSYAAPEEIIGAGTRSPTADVFALGKLLEYLLTGHEPISPVGSPPIIKDRKGVPPVLVDIVARCIAQDPADRYQYVDDLLADLTKFERQGAAAVLNASIRPGALSRLKAGPSIAPPAPRKRERVAPKPVVTKPLVEEKWLSRRTELLAGSLGVACLLFGVALFWFLPSSVDRLETVGLAVALLGGLAAWLLPRPLEHVRVLRLGTWAAAAALISLVDPIHVSALRWQRDLAAGTALQKEQAIERLVRLGHRDFSQLDLSGLHLNELDLSLADFSGANLTETDLASSFLQESDFTGADLTEANLSNADLRGAKIAEAEGLRRVNCARLTKFPEGFYCRRGRVRPRPAGYASAEPTTSPERASPPQSAARPNPAPVAPAATGATRPLERGAVIKDTLDEPFSLPKK